MKKKNELVMPSSYMVLNEEELMQNTSGWYVNVSQKKFYILPKDIQTCENAVNSILRAVGIDNFQINISAQFSDDSEVKNGVSFEYDSGSFLFSTNLSDAEKELAAKNTFVL